MNLKTQILLASTKTDFVALALAFKEDPCLSNYHKNRINTAMRVQLAGACDYNTAMERREETRKRLLAALAAP